MGSELTPAWQNPSTWPELNDGEVHLWRASLKVGTAALDHYRNLLDHHEIVRVNRYSNALSKNRFIAARGILRELLGNYLNQSFEKLEFSRGAQGKPYLKTAQPPPLQFNTTDSRDTSLYVICRSGEIGLDVEFADRQVRHELIAPRRLTPREYDLYLNCPDDERRLFFLCVWTRKEAYGKARGVGMRYNMRETDLLGADGLENARIEDVDGKGWDIAQIRPDKKLIVCVVTETSVNRFRLLNYSDRFSSQSS